MTEKELEEVIGGNKNIRKADFGNHCYVVWDNLVDLSYDTTYLGGEHTWLEVNFMESGSNFKIEVKDIVALEITEEKLSIFWGDFMNVMGMIINSCCYTLNRKNCENIKQLVWGEDR